MTLKDLRPDEQSPDVFSPGVQANPLLAPALDPIHLIFMLFPVHLYILGYSSLSSGGIS